MALWSRSHSLQQKIIAAIVMVGLLPLVLLLVLIYVEERRALRESTGANFKEAAVEAARRVESHVSRSMNEAQQLATTPFLRTAVSEANRTYEGKDARGFRKSFMIGNSDGSNGISEASFRSLSTKSRPIT